MLVCIEDTSPFKEEEVPYGYITDKQYNDVPHTPDNHALMEKAFLVGGHPGRPCGEPLAYAALVKRARFTLLQRRLPPALPLDRAGFAAASAAPTHQHRAPPPEREVIHIRSSLRTYPSQNQRIAPP